MGQYSRTWLISLVRISKDQKEGVSRYVFISRDLGDEFVSLFIQIVGRILRIGRTEVLVSLLALSCELLPDARVHSHSLAHDPPDSIT